MLCAHAVCIPFDTHTLAYIARLLAARINAPLLSVQDILARQMCVAYFLQHRRVADETRSVLRGCLDVERALQRLALGKGGPRCGIFNSSFSHPSQRFGCNRRIAR